MAMCITLAGHFRSLFLYWVSKPLRRQPRSRASMVQPCATGLGARREISAKAPAGGFEHVSVWDLEAQYRFYFFKQKKAGAREGNLIRRFLRAPTGEPTTRSSRWRWSRREREAAGRSSWPPPCPRSSRRSWRLSCRGYPRVTRQEAVTFSSIPKRPYYVKKSKTGGRYRICAPCRDRTYDLADVNGALYH